MALLKRLPFLAFLPQEHFVLTKNSVDTWLSKSNTVHAVYSGLGEDAQKVVNESLQLQAGDHVYLAHRPRLPKVSHFVLISAEVSAKVAEMNLTDTFRHL